MTGVSVCPAQGRRGRWEAGCRAGPEAYRGGGLEVLFAPIGEGFQYGQYIPALVCEQVVVALGALLVELLFDDARIQPGASVAPPAGCWGCVRWKQPARYRCSYPGAVSLITSECPAVAENLQAVGQRAGRPGILPGWAVCRHGSFLARCVIGSAYQNTVTCKIEVSQINYYFNFVSKWGPG